MPNKDQKTARAERSNLSDIIALIISVISLLFVGYQITKHSAAPKSVVLLTMNDIYRINGIKRGEEGGMARIAAVRSMLEKQSDVLVLHAGDALSPSLLGNTYKGAQMVDVLNRLDLSDAFDENLFVTFGNHEFDASKCNSPNALINSVKASNFTWLAGNLDFTKCPKGNGFSPIEAFKNVKGRAIIKRGGIRFGLFGLTLNNPKYAGLITDRTQSSDKQSTAEKQASDRESYIKAAKRHIAALRAEGADYIIGLTHLTLEDDKALLAALKEDGPDLIIGGHDHSSMVVGPVAGRTIYKQSADAIDVGIHRITKANNRITHSYKKLDLKDGGAQKNKSVQSLTDQWLQIHQAGFCAQKKLLATCLSDPMGRTKIRWDLEELKNRESETAIGNWMTEKIVSVAAANLAGFCPQASANGKAPIMLGLLGSGSLRLNYDIPAQYTLQRREIEELFPFPMEIAAICTTWGAAKRQIEHGLTVKGEGGWPHLSGMNISYKPASSGTGAKIMSMTPQTSGKGGATVKGSSAPSDDMPVLLVANLYIASQGDGYNWGLCTANRPKGVSCADSIKAGAETGAVVIRKDGKIQDLKNIILAEFSAKSDQSVGPRSFEPKMTKVAP